jgi:uncharacterized protein YjaG (DUF416 family)
VCTVEVSTRDVIQDGQFHSLLLMICLWDTMNPLYEVIVNEAMEYPETRIYRRRLKI